MMNSQLGRTILSASSSTPDAMAAAPDEDGSYGEIDHVISSLAAELTEERRPGG
jgi:hypothetical protein